MLKSLNVKKAHLFVLYMAGGLFLWHRNDYLNDIAWRAALFIFGMCVLCELKRLWGGGRRRREAAVIEWGK